MLPIAQLQNRMCKTKMSTNAAQPTPRAHPRPNRSDSSSPQPPPPPSNPNPTFSSSSYSAAAREASTSSGGGGAYTSTSTFKLSSGANSLSSRTSLSSLRETLPENPHIYDFKEICAATNNFLAKRYNSNSSSSQSWRCVLRGKDAIIFQRKFRRKMNTSELKDRLSLICRSHHTSVVHLLGASVSGHHIYLVYDFVAGANLADCLRNPRNPNFTVLSSWISRIQITADLAHGLDYIHNKTGLGVDFVHNRIKSSAIVVSEEASRFRARFCHFGAAQLCGEIPEADRPEKGQSAEIDRSDSGRAQFQGVMGYMSPEFRASGVPTRESDVYAFGVVVLELLSGEEPVKYRLDKARGEFLKSSVIDSAAAAIDGAGGVRQWVDTRLKDSFPVDVAERLTRVALECVHVEPNKRPHMGRVAGKVSKLYLESKTWAENLRFPTDITVSLAPR